MLGWLLVSLVLNPTAAESYPVFEAWRNQSTQWIRVGLDRPQEVLELYTVQPLLVLDGSEVVKTIEPNGTFYILAQQNPGSGFVVQVAAHSSRNAMLKLKNKLVEKFPDEPMNLAPTTGRLVALRVGPYSERDDANQMRAKMIAEGFADAFISRMGRGTRFYWVNDRFDKVELRAAELGLVRMDPHDAIGFAGKRYRGSLHFRRDGDRLRVINRLPLETYLRGVVPSELGPHVFPQIEALKAQAVAARTYALKNMGRFASRGYDICDSPACQAYDGTTNEHPLSDEAVAATGGMVMTYEGELIDALYTSTCGGFTEDVGHVFPGRDDPYLRGVSSYLADYEVWTLPAKSVDREQVAAMPEDLAVNALLYGFPTVPGVKGNLTATGFRAAMGHLAWVLGEPIAFPETEKVAYQTFWQTLARLPFFAEATARQVQDADRARAMRYTTVPEELGSFAAFMSRFGLVRPEQLRTFSSQTPIPALEALTILIGLCEKLGPEPVYRRYRLENVRGDQLEIRRGKQLIDLPLANISHYLSRQGDSLVLVDQPVVEELDLVYTLEEPFRSDLILIRQNGTVASVDRFSSVESWLERKDAETLEERARGYVRGLRGLRDIRILERSETGRVTLLEWVADSGTYRVDGLRIRWSLGIRDNLFDMLPSYKNGRLVHATFTGRGWGHGVGMSQVGAYGLARMGWTYERILKHYYTGIHVASYQVIQSSP